MTELTGDHEVVPDNGPTPILNDVWYRRLEYVARIVLPAMATLYTAVGALWGLSYVPQVVGTIVALDVFLGAFVGLAQRSYDNSAAAYNGTLKVIPKTDGGLAYNMVFDGDPAEIANLSKVSFKVDGSATP